MRAVKHGRGQKARLGGFATAGEKEEGMSGSRRRVWVATTLVLLTAAWVAPSHGAAPGGIAPDDPLFGDQWALTKMQVAEAWQERDATGRGIEIGIVDSGIDLTHEDFACPGKLEVLPGSNVGSKRAPDRPLDVHGHGTYVAGIAGACTDNGLGIAGVAPDATLVPVRILPEFDARGLDSAMARGIDFATDAGTHVVNLSVGEIPPMSHLGAEEFPMTEKAMQRARAKGVVIAAAAGNYVQPICEYPAFSRNVICVVATDPNDLRAPYSDFPVNADPRSETIGLEPAVAAPGGLGPTRCAENVTTTNTMDGYDPCYQDSPYAASAAGTSLAAPQVAGIAALLYDRLGGVRTRANADLIVETIVETADDLYTPGWDPIVGHGRVNALAAVRALPNK